LGYIEYIVASLVGNILYIAMFYFYNDTTLP
jgi:hypothetical protein